MSGKGHGEAAGWREGGKTKKARHTKEETSKEGRGEVGSPSTPLEGGERNGRGDVPLEGGELQRKGG